MADIRLTAGDTFPDIRGAASDEDGLIDLSGADEVLFVASSSDAVIAGEADVLDPPEDGYNWSYQLGADDTSVAGLYSSWLKVTWNASSTPPRVEWITGRDTIKIIEAPQ